MWIISPAWWWYQQQIETARQEQERQEATQMAREIERPILPEPTGIIDWIRENLLLIIGIIVVIVCLVYILK